MLTGYNTDLRFEGVIYHVQSEDRGLQNPVFDTLVYCGGRILHQEKRSYAELVGRPDAEYAIGAALEQQHRDVVRRARHGEFAVLAQGTVAGTSTSVVPLASAVAALLDADAEVTLLHLDWAPERVAAGVAGRLTVTRAADGAPAAGARVTARVVGPGLAPASVLERETDDAGRVRVAVAVPPGASALVLAADAGPGGGRLRLALDNAARGDEPAADPVSAAPAPPAASRAPRSSS